MALVTEDGGRPIVGVVGVDAAYSGPTGLCVRGFRDGAVDPVTHDNCTSMSMRSGQLLRWLAQHAVALCKPGERLALVCEGDAYGSCSVARKLGISIGMVEGLLVDLQAVEPETREDVMTSSWRTVLGRRRLMGARAATSKRERRLRLKAAAVSWAQAEYGLELKSDAAEAAGITEWWLKREGLL